jgi:protein TonB
VSEAGAIASAPPYAAERPQEWALRPRWLRPTAIALALSLQAAAAAFIAAPVLPASPIDAIDVTLVAQGDAAEEMQARDETQPAEAAAPPPPLPAEARAEAAPASPIEAREAVPLPLATPQAEPVATPKPPVVAEKDDRPTPAEWRERRRRQADAAERRRRQADAAERRRKPQAAQQAERLGAEQGRAAANAASRASYASLLAAELNRHKLYPASARAAGVTGSVGVAFTVGAAGEVVSHAITRSSGSSALDRAVEAMVAAVRAPPPPGGSFHASTTVNFSIQ